MNKIKRSWELTKASLNVLKHDKELIVFPIISAVMMVVITLTFLIPTLVGNFLDQIINTGIPFFGYVVLFLFYLVQYFVVYFMSTALVGAAMIRLRGGNPTLKDGFQIALHRISPILGWSLVSATVGVILKMLSNQSKEKGRGLASMLSSLLGAAWSVLTFLVVPVIAVEGLGPIEAVKRSWELLKRSWGEQIVGTMSIGLIFLLIGLAGGGVLVNIGVGLFILLDNVWPVAIIGILLVILIMILSLLNTTLNGIFSASVYAYASEGRVGLIEERLLQNAFD
jgi:ABC-type multidrug transport system fused ATPase/permease subunit